MTAAALESLASAAAATLYDAIRRAETVADLDELAKLLWRSYGDGSISEADATELSNYLDGRRPVRRYIPRQATLPGLSLPKRNQERVGQFPKRCPQRSPDKQASYERRKRLAFSGVLPPTLVVRLTTGDMACLRIVADEYRRRGRCNSSLAEIAARAGVDRKTAQRAVHKAQQQRLISVRKRPVAGQRHLPNVVTIISLEWLRWLRRPAERAGGGGHFVPPTDTSLEVDEGGADRTGAAAPVNAELPQQRPMKEATEFAGELADIAGHRHGVLPRAWRDADAPRLVQGWIDRGVSIKALRSIAATVMLRKRNSFDPGPPHSPLYFAAEIKKLREHRRAQLRREPARRNRS